MFRRRTRLHVETLERRTVPAGWLATAADAGGGPHVIIRADTNQDGKVDVVTDSFFAYDPAFAGGVRVAAADFDGDGRTELVTAAGRGGGPHVKIWSVDADGRVTGLREQFMAFDQKFAGGCWLAAGDLDGASFFLVPGQKAQLVVGAGEGGGPHVKIFKDTDNDGLVSDNLVDEFFAYDAGFTGGVRVTVGNFFEGTVGPTLSISRFNYLVTAAGPGGGPHVKIYNSFGEFDAEGKVSDNGVIHEFMAFDSDYAGGVFVAAGHLSDNGHAVEELIVSGGPTVNIYELRAIQGNSPPSPTIPELPAPHAMERTPVHTFDASPGFDGEVHLGTADLVQDNGFVDLVTAPGKGGNALVTIWSGDAGDGQVSVPPKEDELAAFTDAAGNPFRVGAFTAFIPFPMDL